MKLRILLLLAATLPLSAEPVQAWRGRVGIGIGIGVPIGPYYGGYYGYPYGYPYPYPYPAPVVVSPPPVVVQQPPVVIGQAPPGYYGTQPPANPAPVSPAPQIINGDQSIHALMSQLGQSDENVRRNAAMELGRMHALRSVDHLTAVLGGDMSPQVRDAAALALGLIGAPRALPALTRAAQADNDRDVRRSAQYAIEIIRSADAQLSVFRLRLSGRTLSRKRRIITRSVTTTLSVVLKT